MEDTIFQLIYDFYQAEACGEEDESDADVGELEYGNKHVEAENNNKEQGSKTFDWQMPKMAATTANNNDNATVIVELANTPDKYVCP